MKTPYSVALENIISEFKLESIEIPGDPKNIFVYNADINRPGLELGGYYEYYDADRIQIFGMSEMSYLAQFSAEE